MKHPGQDLVGELEAAAHAAQDHEKRYRADAAREIERLERERVFAFRRIRLARLLASACDGAADETAACALAAGAVAGELGWSTQGETHKPVLDRLNDVTRELWQARGPAGAAADQATPGASALAGFERWYHAHAGLPFYALFDQYVPETPLVDF